MTGAMYAAIAGLKTHMSKMNVIGNNIANVNTNGYKSQRTVFKDAMYTMYRSGSDGTTTTGGRNPAQVGYGSQISTIDLNMGSGSYAPGNALDCMIDGDGFFLVGDKTVADVIDGTNPTSFKSLNLTRVGDFGFDAGGYLVDGTGSCVYGFMAVGVDTEGKPIVSDQLVPIRLPKMETTYTYSQITKEDDGTTTTVEIDKAAYENGLANPDPDGKITYSRKAEYEVLYPEVKDANGDAIALKDAGDDLPFAQLDSISIDESTGRISGTVKDSDEWVTIGFLAIGNVTNPNGVTHTGGFYYQAGDGAGDLQISMLGGAAADLKTIDGGPLQYVNGSLAAGADPDNPVTPSDKAQIGSAGATALLTGGLEGSNVDLATEISEMITTQRGYQANTRIITVTDTMLEELVNMKR